MNRKEKKILKTNLEESDQLLDFLKRTAELSYNFNNIDSFRNFLCDYHDVLCDLHNSGVDIIRELENE